MASTAVSAQGTNVQISTGSGSAKTISGVAVGNPTIITATAHGFSNGDNVTIAGLTGADAATLNGKSYIVKNKTTNTFAIDQDTTGLTITAGSGTATPVAYTSIANVRSFNGFDGAASEIDVTNFLSTAKEFRLGLIDPGQMSLELDFDGSDAGQAAVAAAQSSGSQKTFKIVLTNGQTATFAGFVKKNSMTAGVDQVYRRAVDIRITGAVTIA